MSEGIKMKKTAKSIVLAVAIVTTEEDVKKTAKKSQKLSFNKKDEK